MKKKKTSSPVRGVKKDVAWNRIAVFFVVLAVVVVAIMSLKDSTLSTEMNFYNYVRPVLIPLFAVLTAGAIALWVTRRKKGVDESKSSFPASMMTIFSGGLFVVSVLYPYLSATRLLVSLIAASALYFLYYLYPRAFFVYAAETLIGGLLLSFFRYGTGLVGLIVPLVLLVALEAVMVLMLSGKTSLGKLLPAEKEARYPVALTAVIVLIGLVLGLAAPAYLFYVIALLFAAFLVIAIMNTVRMM